MQYLNARGSTVTEDVAGRNHAAQRIQAVARRNHLEAIKCRGQACELDTSRNGSLSSANDAASARRVAD